MLVEWPIGRKADCNWQREKGKTPTRRCSCRNNTINAMMTTATKVRWLQQNTFNTHFLYFTFYYYIIHHSVVIQKMTMWNKIDKSVQSTISIRWRDGICHSASYRLVVNILRNTKVMFGPKSDENFKKGQKSLLARRHSMLINLTTASCQTSRVIWECLSF